MMRLLPHKLVLSTTILIISLLANSQIIIRKSDPIVSVCGTPFSGTAQFKFLVYSDSTVLWSNDGSSFSITEPVQSVALDVKNGIYQVGLGDAPMKPLFVDLIGLYPETRLCTWVNIGQGFNKLPIDIIKPDMLAFAEDMDHKLPETRTVQPVPGLVGNSTHADRNAVKEKEAKEENEGATNTEGRILQWRLQHADSKGHIPFDGLIQAKNHIDHMPKNKDAGLWNWEWLGPGNIGGRIRAIVINPSNPNIIFIGSVSGGIWKSTNGGSSWTVVNDFLPNLAITAIVYDPTNLNIMYASTGEGYSNADGLPGAGIFKSTDGGTVWEQLASTNDTSFRIVNRIVHHPDSTGVLYAATRRPNKVWKTKNGGNTWKMVFDSKFPVTDIKISPHHTNLVIAGTSFSANRSLDYGATWDTLTDGTPDKLISNPGRCEIAFCNSDENMVYLVMEGYAGGIFRSEDQGETWKSKNRSTGFTSNGVQNQGNYDLAIWVNPTDTANIIVGGIDLWQSTNGGRNLSPISDWSNYHNNSGANSAHADQHIIINHPGFNNTTNKIVYFGNDGGIQRANDISTVTQSSGWTNLAGTTLGITQFYGGAAATDGSYIIGGTQDNDHLRFKPSGAWSGAGNWFQEETGDGGFAAIDFTNADIQYSEYPYLKISKSIDGGETNDLKTNGLSDAGNDGDNALFVAPFVMDPNHANNLIAGGISIWRTTDAAENWSRIRGFISDTTKCSAIDVANGNSDLIWVGYSDGQVAYTLNGTAASPAWHRVDNHATTLPDRYVTDIAINPNDHNEVYVTFGGYHPDNVWFTSDGGGSWENRSGYVPNNLPALQVNTVRVHPINRNWVYIGTDMGVFSSDNKGLNWSVDPRYASENNELPANVEVDEIFWQGNEYLIAATHGRGMYRSHPLSIIYVDKAAAPGGNGSQAAPFQTVTQAVNAAGSSSAISIKSNTYNETPLRFYKKGRVMSTNGATIIK